MQALDIMIDHVIHVHEKDTIRTVLDKFIDHGISGLPVVNNSNEIVGYISDGDIMQFIGKHKDIVLDVILLVSVIKGDQDQFEERARNILALNVMELANKKVIKVKWNEEIENVAAVLGEKRIKKLPVERDGKLVGIISRGDVIRNAFKDLLHK
ncbi:CBS domain-containing protein [Paenibacillus oenotherae]|uniref:CBS domain-containing protein n=1 Tax=Paenibacillus oenotherae TaxID=1435645 RepID=A0ABS7D1S5_9BACL|nr:CBS domain-containing protein [Paenibacillus oenotherae]MBW7473894.1 CBS domain-containing protein [Paenibacillus oenotherae]